MFGRQSTDNCPYHGHWRCDVRAQINFVYPLILFSWNAVTETLAICRICIYICYLTVPQCFHNKSHLTTHPCTAWHKSVYDGFYYSWTVIAYSGSPFIFWIAHDFFQVLKLETEQLFALWITEPGEKSAEPAACHVIFPLYTNINQICISGGGICWCFREKVYHWSTPNHLCVQCSSQNMIQSLLFPPSNYFKIQGHFEWTAHIKVSFFNLKNMQLYRKD